MRHLCLLISYIASGAMLLVSGGTLAQPSVGAYPSRQVVIIVAAAPGGPLDVEARLYAKKMSDLTGQSFIVDFKPGAGGTIGTAYVAKAAPDGYTLLVVFASFTTFPALYKDLSFDTIKSFSPVSLISKRAIALVAHPSFPAKTAAEYLAYAKTNPGKINFGTSGAGGAGHLAGAWLHSATNTKVTFVHYKGTGSLVSDLTAGRLDVTPAALSPVLQLVKTGKLFVVALMGKERSRIFPDVYTIAEQGVPEYDYASWTGFSAPSGTSEAIVSALSEGFAKVAKMPDVTAALEAAGGVTIGSTPAQFREFLVVEADRWRKVVQDSGIKLEE